MTDQNNLNTTPDDSLDINQQPVDENQEIKTKNNKKNLLFLLFTAVFIIILSGAVIFLYYQTSNTQSDQVIENNINKKTTNKTVNPHKTTVENVDNIQQDKITETTDNIVDKIYDNTYLISDNSTIYEADLSGNKRKIVDLPFTQPIEILETYISADKSTFLWTHTSYPKNDMTPEPRDMASYLYIRDIDSLKKFNTLETKTNEQKIFPIQLSPNGKYLIAKKIEKNNKVQLVTIDTETEKESTIFVNYVRRWDQFDGYDEIENAEFKRWNDDSQNFYYTKYLSTNNADSKLWITQYIKLLKYNLNSGQSSIVLDGKEVCDDPVSIIPSKYNENVVIVSCGSNEYDEMIRVYRTDITTKKSEFVFEDYNRNITGISVKSLTPDGDKFNYYSLQESSEYIYDIEKKVSKKIDLKQKVSGQIYFLNDSTKILYENQHLPILINGIFSYDIETGKINQIFNDELLHIIDL